MSDELIEAAAKAFCRWENPEPGSSGCKDCRSARWRFNVNTMEDDYINLPDGCLGLGYMEPARAAYAILGPVLLEKGAAMAKRKGQELYIGTETWAAFNALDAAAIARSEP